uniref:transcription factor protein isoform X2 n=1 Tax=Ciona intestinalis TaxID=7719 RepID=UPI0000524538|nr:transcription factor protein isoform X2 [Ciona intestinalis]|eukprot:XP_018666946.1 transcription factor protein isoform X2 [Ciona intestinalis]
MLSQFKDNKMLSCENEEVPPSTYRRQRRREKSRDAARCRRNKECDIFQEICDNLPVAHDVIGQLDRSALLRLVISYIKLRQALPKTMFSDSIADVISDLSIKQENPAPVISNDDYVNALNGFILIISTDYDILYASENVKEYLGLSHLDLIVQNILSYTHEGDHDDIRNCFRESEGKSLRKSFFLRMKSTLTPNGKTTNLKSASYKVLRCTGMITPSQAQSDTSAFVAHVQPIPHPSNIQHVLDSRTFLSRHSPDMKFTYWDERMSEILDYDAEGLMGKSFYDYVHVMDAKAIANSFQKLYRLGQIETERYRFLNKNGGYHWVITQATVITGNKNQKAQCVVCIHYVIGESTETEMIFSSEQLQCARLLQIKEQEATISTQDLTLELSPNCVFDDRPLTCDVFPVNTAMPEEQQPADDDCSIVPLTFAVLDENDNLCGDDVFFNAPSIGDPWSFTSSATSVQEKLEDLFSYVAVDNLQAPQAGQEFCDMSKPQCAPLTHQLNVGKQDFTWNRGENPSAPVSPCDSAYCGSPIPLLPPFPELEPPDERNVYQQRKRAYQNVPVSSEQYREHQENMRRGFVLNKDPAFIAKPRKRYRQESECNRKLADMPEFVAAESKRRCYELGQATAQPTKQANNMNDFTFQQFANVLLQPGTGYGPTGNSCGGNKGGAILSSNFLLQPSADFGQANTTGRGLPRNSSGILPELSLHDCEVNAPLPGRGFFPVGVECVHALDEVF